MAGLRRVALFLVAPAFLLATGALLFPAGGRDDAHIGYWVALALSRFGRVMNYNGDAIEQSSTLLHALILAAAHRLTHIDMVILGRLSAVIFGVVAVLVVQQLAARIDRRLVLSAGLLTASSAYFAYWSFGGMEATLCALLAVWIVMLFGDYTAEPNERLLSSKLALIAIATFAFLLVRPEQPLVLFCMLGGAVVLSFLNNTPRRKISVLIGVVVVIAAGIFIWRWQTFGSLFPQPVSAKSGSMSAHTLKAGLRYYRKHILLEPGVAVFSVAVVGGAACAWRKILREKSTHLLFALLFLVSYSAFILLAGGDWMEAGRFFVPLLPITALLAAFGLLQLTQTRPRLAPICIIAIVVAQLSGIYRVAAHDSTAVPFWSAVITEPYATESRAIDFTWFERFNRPNLRDIPTVRRLDELVRQLRQAKIETQPVRIMSAQLGMVAYYVVGKHFGHVEILDRRGLVDRRFSSCPLLAQLDRTAGGLQLDYDYYFAHRAELERDCHIQRPDIIFDIGEPPALPDYTVVYRQSGTIRTNSKWFSGAAFRASQFIAVRNDLLGALSPNEWEAIQTQ